MNGYAVNQTLRNLRPVKLELGSEYHMDAGYPRVFNNIVRVKFIQPTEKGFNFIDIKTHKCVMTKHIYVSKCDYHKSDLWFWLPKELVLTKIEN
jgi:hypothetical protein